MPSNHHPRMLHEYYVDKLRHIMDRRRKTVDGLKNRTQAERYVQKVRRAVRQSFRSMPKKTPLNLQTTRTTEAEGYRIEHVVFESRPQFFVTGCLYVPQPATDQKRPCVLGLCGHSGEGKAADPYQSFCQGLVRHGFVVLMIDPIQQGERYQFDDGDDQPGLCPAHNLMGNRQVLLDDFFGTWRVWDAIRALDVLLGRDDIDRSRVGVTGNSGGGTLTTWLTAVEPRITMAAPSCFVTSWLNNLENEMPADAEQNPPGLLAAGLDEADLLVCYAPRPTLVLSQAGDYFDVRGAEAAYRDVKRINYLLGRGDDVEFFVGPRTHGYFKENREAMLAFFMKQAGIEGDPLEGDVIVRPPQELFCTETGRVIDLGSTSVNAFNSRRAAELARLRGKPAESRLRPAVEQVLALPKSEGIPHWRVPRTRPSGDESVNPQWQFVVETEPGIRIPIHTYGPDHEPVHLPDGDVVVYVGHRSGQEDVESIDEVAELARTERPLVVVDPRGIGAASPDTCSRRTRDVFHLYGADYLYASLGDMLDAPLLGGRVLDIMRTMDLLLAAGADSVSLVGRGLGSVPVALAGLLHHSAPEVRLLDYLESWQWLVDHPRVDWPLSLMPRGVLKHFDLPDVYFALGRRLSKGRPWLPEQRVCAE